MKKYFFIIAFLSLSGCSVQPLDPSSMQASPAVYDQIEKDFYLKNKIMVMPVQSELPPKPLNSKFYDEIYANATSALMQSLSKAGMLSDSSVHAEYNLEATLVDVQNPRCFFGTCETGSAIRYVLKKDGRVVYKDILVVPQNYDYPAFGANLDYVIRESFGVALGNNFAHLIHVLSTKKKEELQ